MSSDSNSEPEPESELNLKIVNVDKKKVLDLGDLFYGDDRAVYFGASCLSVFQTLKWKSFGQLMEKERINYRKTGVPRGLGQLEIPEELISMIFEQINDVRTVFRLGVANTRLMIIGERRIKQLVGLNWTGDRLICVEDGGSNIDLPEGLDTGDVYGGFESCAEPEDLRRALQRGLKSDTPESCIADDLAEVVSIQPEVIWNFTKHVYVRADAMPEDLASENEDEFIMGWTLLVHIIWTNSAVLGRGGWAGDRFELTGKDVLEARLQEDGRKWIDVSEEAFQFLKNSEQICLILGLD